jgi:hypothetical protein
MNTPAGIVRVAAGCLAATLVAACATESRPGASESTPPASPALAGSPAATAVAKLSKDLTGAQVMALLGPPATTKPLSTGGDRTKIWSYPFRGATEVRMVAVATQEVSATNPLTGQATTRSEPVYQNQTVDTIDTLHLLMVDDRLIEWRVVRDEKSQFH